MISNDKLKEIMYFNVANGDAKTLETFGLTETSLKRYKRILKKDNEKALVLSEIGNKYDLETLSLIAKVNEKKDSIKKVVSFDGEHYRFLWFTDPHMGEKHFKEYVLESAFEESYRLGVKKAYLGGDVSEGMSHRPGQIYELDKIGYDAQKEYAIEQLNKFDGEIYMIDGNHDRWFIKSNGAIIVKDICLANENWHYLGHDEGDVEVNGVIIRMFHGEDSSSYATSYRVQKLVESFQGGEKPNILLTGHTHKQGLFFERNIHCILGGCIEFQTKWMRSKRISAHVGFWIVDAVIADKEVKSLTTTWYPIYK